MEGSERPRRETKNRPASLTRAPLKSAVGGSRQPVGQGDQAGSAEALGPLTTCLMKDAEKDWTSEDLQRIARGKFFTTQVLTEILDVLAEKPGDWLTSAELAAATGREANTIKRIWTHVGRHINKRYEGLPWPLEAKWGLNFDPARKAVVYYRTTAEQAAAWTSARATAK